METRHRISRRRPTRQTSDNEEMAQLILDSDPGPFTPPATPESRRSTTTSNENESDDGAAASSSTSVARGPILATRPSGSESDGGAVASRSTSGARASILASDDGAVASTSTAGACGSSSAPVQKQVRRTLDLPPLVGTGIPPCKKRKKLTSSQAQAQALELLLEKDDPVVDNITQHHTEISSAVKLLPQVMTEIKTVLNDIKNVLKEGTEDIKNVLKEGTEVLYTLLDNRINENLHSGNE